MIEFVPIDSHHYGDVAAVERDAYNLHTGLYDDSKELHVALGHHAAKRFSFLAKDGDYKGFCIASFQASLTDANSGNEVLYISDIAVRKGSQGLYYGFAMGEELMRRAVEENVEYMEFHALGSTSYRATKYE